MQSLPLEAKVRMTQQRIRQWYDHWEGDVYVSFSGGKDSTVLKHIVDNTPGVWDVPAVFVNTGLEYPEIQKFVKDVKAGKWDCFNSDVVILRPEMRFDEVINNYGYPVISKEVSKYVKEARSAIQRGRDDYYALQKLQGTLKDKDGNKSIFNCEKWGFMIDAPYKISYECCNVMKKRPAKKYAKETGRKPIIATMAVESRLRYAKWLRFGCNAFDQKDPSSQPMSFWTEQDVLHYIKKYNVPYCPVYGDIQVKPPEGTEDGQMNVIDYLGCWDETDILETTGCNRTGCIFCMFGCHLEKEPNRFQQLKETHPRQYEYCIGGGEMVDGKWQPSKEGLGLGHVLDYIGVKYE
jgi:3'-phosphoadenosine 5'-phosphosulfate sulfotransferase (PAPS reductase)/FAD synthetase